MSFAKRWLATMDSWLGREPPPTPTAGHVRCPNCEERFIVSAGGRDMTAYELTVALYAHFLAKHPGQAVGAGTTETA